LIKITPDLEKCLWKKMKINKPQMNTRAVNEKATTFVVPDISTIVVAIDNHMVVIQVHIDKNIIDDVFLDGGSKLNIITKQLRTRLRLPKPKLVFYNL